MGDTWEGVKLKTDKKILLVKQWLRGDEALSLLEQLTGTSVYVGDACDLINDQGVDFYVRGECFDVAFDPPDIGYPVTTVKGETAYLKHADFFKVVSENSLATIERSPGHEFLSLGIYLGATLPVIEGVEDSTGRLVRGRPFSRPNHLTGRGFAYFKPQDIQKLADIINGTEQDTELEQLRQQAAKAASLQREVSHLRSRLSQAVQDNEFLRGWKDRHGQDLEQLRQQITDLEVENGQLRQQVAGNDETADPRSQKSAGQIIASLAAMANVDISKPYAAFESLSTQAAAKGLAFPQSKDTLKRHFENARKASKPEV